MSLNSIQIFIISNDNNVCLFDKDNTIITTESNRVMEIQYNYELHWYSLAFTNDLEFCCSCVIGIVFPIYY